MDDYIDASKKLIDAHGRVIQLDKEEAKLLTELQSISYSNDSQYLRHLDNQQIEEKRPFSEQAIEVFKTKDVKRKIVKESQLKAFHQNLADSHVPSNNS